MDDSALRAGLIGQKAEGDWPEHEVTATAAHACARDVIVSSIQQECRGRSPLPGFGVSPKNLLFPFFAAVGGMKELAM